MNNVHKNKKYAEWICNLKEKFRQVQIKAAVKVNNELLNFIGTLVKKLMKNKKKQNGVIN